MARRRPVHPAALEWEETVMLRAIEEYVALLRERDPGWYPPHRQPMIRAQDLVDQWPLRFSSYRRRANWWDGGHRVPGIPTHSCLKRMSQKGKLRRSFGGPVRYSLPLAENAAGGGRGRRAA